MQILKNMQDVLLKKNVTLVCHCFSARPVYISCMSSKPLNYPLQLSYLTLNKNLKQVNKVNIYSGSLCTGCPEFDPHTATVKLRQSCAIQGSTTFHQKPQRNPNTSGDTQRKYKFFGIVSMFSSLYLKSHFNVYCSLT